MHWKTIVLLVSIAIYLIWFIILYYTNIKRVQTINYDRKIVYEKVPIRLWFIFVSILTLLLPIFNVFCSVLWPLGYLGICSGDYGEPVLKAKDDIFCNILKAIGNFLSKSIN